MNFKGTRGPDRIPPTIAKIIPEGRPRTQWYVEDVDENDGMDEADDDDNSLEIDIMEVLQRTAVGMKKFQKLLDDRTTSFEDTITALRGIAKSVDRFHHGATIASITGGAVSAVGGITTVVGMILAPFTFGASLIVTGVGLGVAAAGGVTSASATISDTMNERMERAKVEDLIRKYQEDMKAVELCLTSVHCQLEELSRHPDFSKINSQELQAVAFTALPRAGRGVANVVEIVKLVQLGKAAGGLARGIRIAGVATGILTGLFLVMDAVYIAKDVKDLQDGAKTAAAEKIREAADELEKGLHELRELSETFRRAQIRRRQTAANPRRNEAALDTPLISSRLQQPHRRAAHRQFWHGPRSPISREHQRQRQRHFHRQQCQSNGPSAGSL